MKSKTKELPNFKIKKNDVKVACKSKVMSTLKIISLFIRENIEIINNSFLISFISQDIV